MVQEEARRLKEIWEKADAAQRGTQADFGETHFIGNQSAVGQFLRGKTALSLKAAKGFAKGLGCRIADFSPRLAAMESSWPFELVDRERYEALPPALRYKAQVRMQDEVEALEEALKANGTIS
jgi:hypothetical protein